MNVDHLVSVIDYKKITVPYLLLLTVIRQSCCAFPVNAAGGEILKALLNVMEKTAQNVNKVLAGLTVSSVYRAFIRAQIPLGFTSRDPWHY